MSFFAEGMPLNTNCIGGCCDETNWFCCTNNFGCAETPFNCPDFNDTESSTMKNLDCPDVKYTEYAETRFDCSDWKNFDVES